MWPDLRYYPNIVIERYDVFLALSIYLSIYIVHIYFMSHTQPCV
jgi:hypothetical protein